MGARKVGIRVYDRLLRARRRFTCDWVEKPLHPRSLMLQPANRRPCANVPELIQLWIICDTQPRSFFSLDRKTTLTPSTICH
jgi:hypothetical protein